MDRRSFLKRTSAAALLAVGEWSGLSKAFSQPESNHTVKNAGQNVEKKSNMEHRRLGGMDVSAIGLGCLPMVGYYGGNNPNHLDDFLGAANVRLTPYEMEEFDKEYAQIDLMGHRADPFTESQIDK